jgi:NAD-dependent dihydropyrimidine dehydrogenase PreA subunit
MQGDVIMKNIKQILQIDEELCDGCGMCVHVCNGGSLEIVNGKAKFVNEASCDAMGACIGNCPRGAISLVERVAEPFDAKQVLKEHLEEDRQAREADKMNPEKKPAVPSPEVKPSKLGNWPVQLRLVPVHSETFEGAKLLVAADCTPFAYRDFHDTFMGDRTVLIGCPKHEDADIYREKLVQLFQEQNIESVEIVVMEVPCCQGLVNTVRQALREAGKSCKVTTSRVSVKGELSEHQKPLEE